MEGRLDSLMSRWRISWKVRWNSRLIIRRLKNRFSSRLIKMILIISILRMEELMICKNHLILYYHHNNNSSSSNSHSHSSNSHSNSSSLMGLIYKVWAKNWKEISKKSSSKGDKIIVNVFHLKKKTKCMKNVMVLVNVSTIVSWSMEIE